jgi:polysaccharide biosynthesis transport protein
MPAPTVNAAEAQPGLKLQDVLFILFRHQWKILICGGLGLAAAAAVYLTTPRPYEASSKLLVRYVMDQGGIDSLANEARMRSPDDRGDSIINNEIQILNSTDLRLEVAATVGPERILGGQSAETNVLVAAARQIGKSLSVTPEPRSSVITVSYTHTDPGLAREILSELISRYHQKHFEVHRSSDMFDFLTRQTDVLKGQLSEAESRLQELKSKAGVVSLDESKHNLAAQIDKVQQSIYDSEAELASHRARLGEIEKQFSLRGPAGAVSAPSTNAPAPIDEAVLEKYRVLAERLVFLRKQELGFLSQYTTVHPQVVSVQNQIAAADEQRRHLERDNPGLALVAAATGISSTLGPARESPVDTTLEHAQIASLEARLVALRQQLTNSLTANVRLDGSESEIARLERERRLLETNYVYFSQQLQKAQTDEQIDRKKSPNISDIGKPFVQRPARLKLKKLVLSIAAAGFGLGIGLAFLIELLFDQSVKRPLDVESRLRIPLLLAIPFVRRSGRANGHAEMLLTDESWLTQGAPSEGQNEKRGADRRGRGDQSVWRERPVSQGDPSAELRISEILELRQSRPRPARRSDLPVPHSSDALTIWSPEAQLGPGSPAPDTPRQAPWEFAHFIRPYCEALRDRLILSFRIKNMVHKPKLVAVTGCAEGSGATTIAGGLAATLSETGEGKVLLVDMSTRPPGVHPFSRGSPVSALTDMIQPGRAQEAAVADNLYLASATTPGDPKPASMIAKQFNDVMPRLKASDFDYIVFDMPSVTQSSATMALAGYMDQVLLVVEAEKTDRDNLKRAYSILSHVQPNVLGIFNKGRDYVPRFLKQG